MWAATSGAVIDTAATGISDPGWARLHQASSCDGFAAVSQVVALPSPDAGERLAIRYASRRDGAGVARVAAFVGNALSMGGCLGDGIHVGAPLLTLRGVDTCQVAGLAVDNVSIVSDPTCPLPGTVYNADFSQGAGGTEGWLVYPFGSGEVQGGRYTWQGPLGCSVYGLAGSFSVPRSASSPRLVVEVGASGYPAGSLSGELAISGAVEMKVPLKLIAGTQTVEVCLPRGLRGNAALVNIVMRESPCSAGPMRALSIGGFQIDEAPSECPPEVDGLFNPGFEDQLSGWFQGVMVTDAAFGTTPGLSQVVQTDPVHGGSSAYRSIIPTRCSRTEVFQSITVPSASGDAGPAVVFHAMKEATAPTEFVATFTGYGSSVSYAPVSGQPGQYGRRVLCLPPAYAGLSGKLSFVHQPVSPGFQASCGEPLAQASDGGLPEFRLDDIAVTVDSECPAR